MSRSPKIVLGVLGGTVPVLVLLTVFAGSGIFGSDLNMDQDGMMGSGWGTFGVIGMLVPLSFIGGLIAIVVWTVTQTGSGGNGAGRYGSGSAGEVHERSAEEILRQRFAKGEINAQEFEERHRVLSEEPPSAERPPSNDHVIAPHIVDDTPVDALPHRQ